MFNKLHRKGDYIQLWMPILMLDKKWTAHKNIRHQI
jgi:hypothetical protein